MAKRWMIGTALAGSISLLGGAAVAQTMEDPLRVEEQAGAGELQEEQAMGGAGRAGMEESIWNQMGQSFTVEGTLTEQDGNDLTISRPNLPPMQVEVHDRTRLNFPGRDVTYQSLEQLPIGSEVRARFQVSGTEVIALSLEPAKGAHKKQKSQTDQPSR